MDNFNLVVRRIRAALGLSQSEFGELIGMSVSMVSAVEGGTRNMSPNALTLLGTALNLSMEEIELIAQPDNSDLPPQYAALADATRNVLVRAVRAQLEARRALGIESPA